MPAGAWLADKDGKVKPSTLKGYKVVANRAIRGPLLIGTKAGTRRIHRERLRPGAVF